MTTASKSKAGSVLQARAMPALLAMRAAILADARGRREADLFCSHTGEAPQRASADPSGGRFRRACLGHAFSPVAKPRTYPVERRARTAVPPRETGSPAPPVM